MFRFVLVWPLPPQVLASGVPSFRGKFSVDRHGGHERGFHLAYPRPGTRPGASAKVTYSFIGPIRPIGRTDPVEDISCCFMRYTIDLLCMIPVDRFTGLNGSTRNTL